MCAAAPQSIVATQAMDAPLDARAPAITAPPAPLLFPRPLRRAQRPGAGDDHVRDAQAVRALLHALGVQPAVPGHQPRGPPEDRPVMLYGRQGLVTLGFGVAQHVESRGDPALHLVEDDLSPELPGRAAPPPLYDLGVGLEQAEHLLRGRHRLALEHAGPRLPVPFVDQ